MFRQHIYPEINVYQFLLHKKFKIITWQPSYISCYININKSRYYIETKKNLLIFKVVFIINKIYKVVLKLVFKTIPKL